MSGAPSHHRNSCQVRKRPCREAVPSWRVTAFVSARRSKAAVISYGPPAAGRGPRRRLRPGPISRSCTRSGGAGTDRRPDASDDPVSGLAIFPDQDSRWGLRASFGLAPEPRRQSRERRALRPQLPLERTPGGQSGNAHAGPGIHVTSDVELYRGDVAPEAFPLREPREPRIHAGHGAAPSAEDPPPVDRRSGRDVGQRETLPRQVVAARELRLQGLDRACDLLARLVRGPGGALLLGEAPELQDLGVEGRLQMLVRPGPSTGRRGPGSRGVRRGGCRRRTGSPRRRGSRSTPRARTRRRRSPGSCRSGSWRGTRARRHPRRASLRSRRGRPDPSSRSRGSARTPPRPRRRPRAPAWCRWNSAVPRS